MKLNRIRVTIVGSHLFEPTHYSLVGLLHEIGKEVEVRVFAKHPMPHPESGTDAPLTLMIPRNQRWRPDTDIVHAVGGGETAIRVSDALDPKIPMIVSFVGGADLSRQLRLKRLRDGYQRLFERVRFVTYPDRFGLSQLEAFGAPSNKLVWIPAALPIHSYEIAHPSREMLAVMVGRPIPRKGHVRAAEVAKLSKYLNKLIIVGKRDPEINGNPRVIQIDRLPHDELLKLISRSDVLLQTGDWEGEEIDSLPTIILETLVMGVPVVSTPLAGVVEFARKFPNFVRVAENVSELARELDQMLICDMRPKFSEVRRWIFQQHGLAQVAQRILYLYKELLR
ncbi:glycosyltransferase family 4 protein [Dehalococcoidia bacterium]|nr:glycosyltransferase family 4 protein [Dehalococcoidia bacterium]